MGVSMVLTSNMRLPSDIIVIFISIENIVVTGSTNIRFD